MASKKAANAPKSRTKTRAEADPTPGPGASKKPPRKALRNNTPPPPLAKGVVKPPPAKADSGPGDVLSLGRPACVIQRRETRWLFRPWISRGNLGYVVGQTGVGKSSFIAFLCSKAASVILLPGYEESFEEVTLQRLEAHGVDLSNVHVLDDRPYCLRANHEVLVKIALAHRADLIVFDPIDSYMDQGGHENDSQHVRPCLEAAQALAERTGAAVIGVRHPGRDPNNVCPGGRAWSNVPRSVCELVKEHGSPPQYFLSPWKHSLPDKPSPLSYTLAHNGSLPPIFTVGQAVSAETADIAREVPDRLERSKVQIAVELLRDVLAEQKLEAREVFSLGDRERLSEHTMRRAARLLNVEYTRDGYGLGCKCLWALPGAAKPVTQGEGGGVPVTLATSGRKPRKQGRRSLVARDTGTPPPGATNGAPTAPGVLRLPQLLRD